MEETLDSLYDEANDFIPKSGLKFVPDSKDPETDTKIMAYVLANCAFEDDFQALVTSHDVKEFLTKRGVMEADIYKSMSRLNSYFIPQGRVICEIDGKGVWVPLYRPSSIFKQMGIRYVERGLERDI